MKTKSSHIKVGILTILSILVLIIGTFFVGKFQFFQKTYNMEVYFDFVSGLQEGAPVRLNGVRVGSVKNISIKPEVKPPIVVTMQLIESARMHTDARVFINTLGLMGEKYVEIYAGSADQPYLNKGAPLTGQSPTELQDILNASKIVADNLALTMESFAEIFTQESTKISFQNFIQRLDSVSKNIDDTIAGRKDDIDLFAKNLRILSDNMLSTVNTMETIIKENRGDIRTITNNLAETSDGIRKQSAKISENLEILSRELLDASTTAKPDFQSTVKNFQEASEGFKESMKKLEIIMNRIEMGQGTVGKLVSEDLLYSQATETMEKVSQAAETLSTGGEFLSKIKYEYELRYRDKLSRWRNDIHILVIPNESKYYLIGASDIGRDVGLDLLYAKRQGSFDIKLGVMESEAAAGVDYNLVKNRLLFGILGIGLSEDDPRLDFHTSARIGNYFDVDWYILAGAEDLTDDPKANAGFQIRY